NAVILPPSILAALPFEPLPELRCLTVAGEACPVELVQRWGPGRCFVDAYGPTEATVCATVAQITPDDVADGKPPTIGRAMGRTRIHVCDANLQPVPVGVPGELLLGGPGLALGYLNQPGLTAERFIPNPFSAEDGATLYRTGDLVRWRP